MWYCNKQLRALTLRGLLLSLLKSCPAAVWTNEQIQLGCCRTGDHVEQWGPIPAEPGIQWMTYGIMNEVHHWSWHAGFSGKLVLRWSQKWKIPVKGKGKEAGCGWGREKGRSHQSIMPLTSLHQGLPLQRLPVSQILNWTEMARLLYHSLVLASGGCYPERRTTSLKTASQLYFFLSSSELSLEKQSEWYISGFNPASFRVICYAAKANWVI